MSATLLSTITLLLVSYTHNVNASWRMRAANLLTARMDPLVSPNGVSSHVHSVTGGSNFANTYDFNKLRESPCSSVEVQDDKSNYWAPPLYYKHRDTGKYQLVPSDWAVYYLHRGTETDVKQFPEGFSMIAGSPGRTEKGNDTANEAFNYHCLGHDGPETFELPKQHCPYGLRIQVMFPACWDGKNVKSSNSKDHVSYPVGTHEGGTCPPSHPVRLMSIFIEQIARTGDFEYYEGAFVLATGDTIGYSSHADFQNGWDASPNSVLQQAINTCKDSGANIDACPILKASMSEAFNVCRPNSLMPVEDIGIYGGLDKLPGDNPIWGGGVPKKLTGVSNTPPYGSPYSSLPQGWVEHGCIDEGDPYVNTMNGDKFVDDYMYPGLCVNHCNEKGYILAGLEAGKECYCANELTHGGTMNLIGQDKCSWVCPGNLYEFCGQSRKISLYKKTNDNTGAGGSSPYPPVGSKFSQVFTQGGTSTPPPVSSPVMNNVATTTTSSAPQVPNTPPPSNPTTTSTTSSAPSVATSSPNTCGNGKLIKRRPSFRKRNLVEPFHLPAKHRRMHH